MVKNYILSLFSIIVIMSSSSEVSVAGNLPIEPIYQASLSSSTDPPMDEWSSLFEIESTEAPKMTLYKQGLYDPGSGEICEKYIPLSDSDVMRHVYYAYPGIKDPGIIDALTGLEKPKVFDNNGQELYLELCETMGMCPVRSFYRGLVERDINLRYYCVNPAGVRAMSRALLYNTSVKRLDLGFNFLSLDACYHLGQLLIENVVLTELLLAGCKIEAEGLRRLIVGFAGRTMDELDLSRNDIGDDGFALLAEKMTKGAVIKRLSVSGNGLGTEAAASLAAALECNNTVTHLNLSWNQLFPAKGSNEVIRALAESDVLVELNMSWNALTTGTALTKLLAVPTLKYLNLSNNRLSTTSTRAICKGLKKVRDLETLDLSYNPLMPADALLILTLFKEQFVSVRNLLMYGVVVEKKFAVTLHEVLSRKIGPITTVTHGKVLHDYVLAVPDMREILLKRLLCITSVKKCTLDVAVFFLTAAKHKEALQVRELMRELKISGATPDEQLVDGLTNAFPGPKTDKGDKTIALAKISEFIRRMWPDKKPLQTPPPEPEKTKGKGKKKNKKK